MTVPVGAGTDRRQYLKELLTARLSESEVDDTANHPYARAVNPSWARLLRGTGTDKEYVRADGLWLFDPAGNKYLDFAGSYGALPFGHTPDDVWAAIRGVAEAKEPVFVQPSLLPAAGQLAERLVQLAPPGLDRVTFANSGAESVEVAIKIARSATGRLGILATERGFHGKTLGALSATGRPTYQVPFGAPIAGFDHIPYGDLAALRAALESAAVKPAAFIVEPIQGEGGIRVAPEGYLAAAKRLCAQHGVLMIADEVQTGLGRTGTLFACEQHDVVPDIMTLAKALGGGVVPAAAVLARSELVTEGFSLRHTSTFANNTVACRVGLAVLDLLTGQEQALLRHVRQMGEHLRSGLEDLRRKYPALITDVRGSGLLLGVELADDINAYGGQGLIGSLAGAENLAMMMCGYLLNVEGVRLAPTLFGNRVLRVEPSLTVSLEECDFFLRAFGATLAAVAGNDSVVLLGHLVGATSTESDVEVTRPRARPAEPPAAGDARCAFVVHPLDVETMYDLDPSLLRLDVRQVRLLLDRFDQAGCEVNDRAFLVGSGRVTSRAGTSAHCELIGLPYTAADLMDMPTDKAVGLVQEAVDLGVERGAEVVGLGAYSSIVTRNAQLLGPVAVPVTTGNAFTVAASVQGVRRAAEESGTDLGAATAAIVGAGGAIGGVLTELLAPVVGRLILVGNPASAGRAERVLGETALRVARALRASDADSAIARCARQGETAEQARDRLLERGFVEITTDVQDAVSRAGVVVAATSSPGSLVLPGLLRPGAIVCDVSQPPNVPDDTTLSRPDVTLFDGGIVALPNGQDFGVRYGLRPGLTYACMAETLLIALDGDHRLATVGRSMQPESLRKLEKLADVHGFELAATSTWRSEHRGAR